MSTESAPAKRVRPAAPAHLGAPGRKLWRALVDKYDFDVWELPILEAACRQRDDLALLEEHLRQNGMMTTGSQGQVRLDQAVTEVRLGRRALTQLLAQLDLPEDPALTGVPSAAAGTPVATGQGSARVSYNSRRASAAANRRWANHRRALGLDRPDEEYVDGTTPR